MSIAYTYIVRCENGALYTGIARDIRARLMTHCSRTGACAKFTRSFPVKELSALWETKDYSSAARLECCIKKMKKSAKEALVMDKGASLAKVFPALAAEEYKRVENLDMYMDIFDKF